MNMASNTTATGVKDPCASDDNEERKSDQFLEADGIYILPNGDSYRGHVINGKKHGQGVYTFNSGAIYDGNWQNNTKHGYGIYYYTDGSKYAGNWDLDKRHGFGAYLYKNGDIYRGNWDNHLRHGTGVYKYESGVIYEGVWNMNTRIKTTYKGPEVVHSSVESTEYSSGDYRSTQTRKEYHRHHSIRESKRHLASEKNKIHEQMELLQKRLEQLRKEGESKKSSRRVQRSATQKDEAMHRMQNEFREGSLAGEHDRTDRRGTRYAKTSKMKRSKKLDEKESKNFKNSEGKTRLRRNKKSVRRHEKHGHVHVTPKMTRSSLPYIDIMLSTNDSKRTLDKRPSVATIYSGDFHSVPSLCHAVECVVSHQEIRNINLPRCA